MNEDQLETCCLCPKGISLQEALVNHLIQCHTEPQDNDSINFYPSLETCDCSEGLNLQTALLKHLLSHVALSKHPEEISTLEDELHESQETIESEPETCGESELQKKKPSYHKKFNRRDRSPATEKLQKEFTFDSANKTFLCNFCRNSYKHKQSVEKHLVKEHDARKLVIQNQTSSDGKASTECKDKQFSCGICQKTYQHKQTVHRHLAKEHNFVLTKPRETFSNPKPEALKRLTCDLCAQRFHFRESLRKHLLRHVKQRSGSPQEKKPKEKIICDQCSKLVQRSLMKRHLMVHHSDSRPYHCYEPGCKTSFLDLSKFKDHKNIHLNIKPYVCEFCQESFHFANSWRHHRLRHTHPDRFKCEICSNCFVSTKSLRIHMRQHTDDTNAPKTFICKHEGCDKAFRYVDRLNIHVATVHRVESEQRCDLCPYVTSKKRYFNRHLLKVHKIQPNHSRTRVFPTTFESGTLL